LEVGGRTAALVFGLCAAPRIAALVYFTNPPETQYAALARSLAGAHRYWLDGVPTARIEPLCPLLFAASWLPVRSMLVLPLALASLAGVTFFSLARNATNDVRAAWIAVLLYAWSPYLIRQAASPMEVTVAVPLLMFAAWRVRDVRTPVRAAIAGLLFGAIVLTRFAFLPIAIAGVWLVSARDGLRRGALAGVVAIACVVPWVAYSRVTDGSFWPSRVGENLYVGTNEWTRMVVPQTNVDVLMPLVTDVVNGETNPDRVLLRHAVDYALQHPLSVATLKLRNLLYSLQPRLLPFTERAGSAALVDGVLVLPEQRPRPAAYEWIAGVFQGVLLAGGAVGLWERRKRLPEDAFPLIVLGGILAVNVIFYPTTRLLAPASFVLMFYTAVACTGLRRRAIGR
jgi:hypothetical protein